MIKTIANPPEFAPVRSNLTRPKRAIHSLAAPAAPPEPRDGAELSGTPPVTSRAEATPRKPVLSSALALAALGLVALPAVAGAAEALAPVPVQAEADLPSTEDPVDHAQLKKLHRVATPSLQDNYSARSVRGGLEQSLVEIETQAGSFNALASDLMRQARELEESDRQIGPRIPFGPCQTPTGDFTLKSDRWDGSSLFTGHQGSVWTVRHTNAEGQTRSLVDSPEGRTVRVDGVTAHFNRIDGSFEVSRQVSPNIRQEVRTFPGQAVLERERVDLVTSAQGTKEFTTREVWQRPEYTITVYPQPELSYRATYVNGTEVVASKNVTVHNDGSTRVTETRGGKPQTRWEPSAH